MKQWLLFIAAFVIPGLVYTQSRQITLGSVVQVPSKILDETREIWVYVPNQGDNSLFSPKNYPVVYVLDGDWYYYSVVSVMQHLSYINGNTICPEMIVVGIPSADRFTNLTPSCDSSYSATSGGNQKFISFIEKELFAYIEANYPVEPWRMLIGHSLGGLTTINTLINHTHLFNAYLAIDPSMWWHKQNSLHETEKALSEKQFEGSRLYIAISNAMDKGMDTLTVKTDTTPNTLHMRSLLELSAHLAANKQNALHYKSKFYPNENHGSIPHIAIYDGLHFIFDYYNLPLTKQDFADTSMNLAYRIENHYKNVSEQMGYKVLPTENTIYTLGFSAMYLKNYPLAEYFFKLNIKNHPESFMAYDSFGDYYNALGDAAQAKRMFTKALSIRDNPDTQKKLQLIKEKE